MLESYEDIEIRNFQHLDTDGRFIVFPEYPEFACVEGIVNAIVHRDYSIIHVTHLFIQNPMG